MSARLTLERALRDNDDASGQTLRGWKIEREAGHIKVRNLSEGQLLLIRASDVAALIEDLEKMAAEWATTKERDS